MSNMQLIGYFGYIYPCGFQIPVFSSDENFYFQVISDDDTYIEGFQVFEMSNYKQDIVYLDHQVQKKVLDFAVYILKFNDTIHVASRPQLKQSAKLFFSCFNPNNNLFFLRDYMAMYKDFRFILCKLFYKINQSEFPKGEILDYMALIFNMPKLKLENLLFVRAENKLRVLQLFEVKSVRSDYFKFLMAHKKSEPVKIIHRKQNSRDKVYYELFPENQTRPGIV